MADSGLNIKLYPKQWQALTTEATAVLFGGAAGAGKSYLIRAAAIIYAIEIPGSTIYVFRRNYGDLIANHVHSHGGFLQMLDSMLRDKLVKFNKQEYCFEFVNGSRIQLAHLNTDADLGSYLGREFTILIIDEATQLAPQSIRFLISRLRLGGLEVPDKWKGKVPRVLFCTNPGGQAHQFLKENWVDLGEGIHQMPEELGGMKHQFIPARLDDNEVLKKNDPNYRAKLLALGVDNPELARALLDGDWEITQSGAIAHWSRAIHVIEPFAIPKSWRVTRSFDFGFSAPGSVLYAAISDGSDYITADGEEKSCPPDSIFIIQEIYLATKDGKGLREEVSVTAKRVKENDDSYAAIGIKVQAGPADNAIFSKDRGKSIGQIFADGGVAWTRSDKSPGSRVTGLRLINQMLYNATLDTPEGPTLKIFNTCPWLIKNLPALQRNPNKPEDADTKGNDHDFDALRYLCMHNNMRVKIASTSGVF
jgi:hypothetical protein